MKELLGKTIVAIEVNEDQSLLQFTTDNYEEIIYQATGDCCSESWFADISFTGRDVLPFIVDKVDEIIMPNFVNKLLELDGRTRQEVDQVYGYRITPLRTKTSFTWPIEIIYRNSSNGYYGGDCELVDKNNKRVMEMVSQAGWTNITEDWSA